MSLWSTTRPTKMLRVESPSSDATINYPISNSRLLIFEIRWPILFTRAPIYFYIVLARNQSLLPSCLFAFLYHAHNMIDSKGTHRRIKRNIQNSFSRKKDTILRKINALRNVDDHIETYFVLRRRGRLYTYTSSEADSWPPTKAQIVGDFNTPIGKD